MSSEQTVCRNCQLSLLTVPRVPKSVPISAYQYISVPISTQGITCLLLSSGCLLGIGGGFSSVSFHACLFLLSHLVLCTFEFQGTHRTGLPTRAKKIYRRPERERARAVHPIFFFPLIVSLINRQCSATKPLVSLTQHSSSSSCLAVLIQPPTNIHNFLSYIVSTSSSPCLDPAAFKPSAAWTMQRLWLASSKDRATEGGPNGRIKTRRARRPFQPPSMETLISQASTMVWKRNLWISSSPLLTTAGRNVSNNRACSVQMPSQRRQAPSFAPTAQLNLSSGPSAIGKAQMDFLNRVDVAKTPGKTEENLNVSYCD